MLLARLAVDGGYMQALSKELVEKLGLTSAFEANFLRYGMNELVYLKPVQVGPVVEIGIFDAAGVLIMSSPNADIAELEVKENMMEVAKVH